MTMTRPLALRLPLVGSRLIEASAGTGKTYTIATLYVRLVLGHGGEAAFPGGRLAPPQILVVTFTEAATLELRDRIRARLSEAAACFRDEPVATPDPLLRALRDDYPSTMWQACARTLDIAADWMDESAISTIHGWCHRMLHEHAFDSQSPLTQTLQTDLSALYADAVRDYWRRFISPLPAADLQLLTPTWPDPAALEQSVKPWGSLMDHGEVADTAPDRVPPAQALAAVRHARATALETLKAPWRSWVDALPAWYAAARERGAINASKLKQNHFSAWCDQLRAWALGAAEVPALSDAAWRRLTPEGMAEVGKDHDRLLHPAWEALAVLRDALNGLPRAEPAVLQHAACWIRQRFEDAKRQRAEIGFDDLLAMLERALCGAAGPRLAERIRQQFPVALIDEFQDTDPRQYRVFDAVYGVARNDARTALVLIGDPKQAIYAFRGADIYTYLRAREAVGDRLESLDTNFRATQALVAAVNACFSAAEAQPGGAFLFRRAGEAAVRHGRHVPFEPVQARGREEVFRVAGEVPAALTFALAETSAPMTLTDYRAGMAEQAATQMVAWLNQAACGQAGFATPDGRWQALRPSDMAVLVNNRHEATAIRAALARRGVRSVYLSDKDTVYATPQAQEVACWLAACAAPDDGRLLRTALATPTLGVSVIELDRLRRDEAAWEARVLQFKGYGGIWRRQGVLPMLRRLLLDFGCADRLLSHDEASAGQRGERILTDVLHLAELLQAASLGLEGEHALLRYLADQRTQPAGGADEHRLRLDSDEALIKVVTIHKSKGLEYPLVFLPFICATRTVSPGRGPVVWHDETGAPQVALELDAALAARADTERLGEDVRKLYVALTRARHATWVGMAQVSGSGANAINHVLGLTPAAEDWPRALSAFVQRCPSMAVVAALPPGQVRWWGDAAPAATGLARRCRRVARVRWRIASYSSLALGSGASIEADGGMNAAPIEGVAASVMAQADDSARAQWLIEALGERIAETPAAAREVRPGPSVHDFPKGAEAGTVLHDALEQAAQLGFAAVVRDPSRLDEAIARACAARGWAAWAALVRAWLQRCVQQPLALPGVPAPGVALAAVPRYRAEMEFWFEAVAVDVAHVDALLHRYVHAGEARPRLDATQVHGMVRGFIDLVVEHAGRYFVIDYKSNWLGPHDLAYTEVAMVRAVLDHRYDLQYALYVLALHRLLRSRVADYDYDRHIGGVGYLFLRGIEAPGHGVMAQRLPRALIEALDAVFAGRGEASS